MAERETFETGTTDGSLTRPHRTSIGLIASSADMSTHGSRRSVRLTKSTTRMNAQSQRRSLKAAARLVLLRTLPLLVLLCLFVAHFFFFPMCE